jgi:hypothetical protein
VEDEGREGAGDDVVLGCGGVGEGASGEVGGDVGGVCAVSMKRGKIVKVELCRGCEFSLE